MRLSRRPATLFASAVCLAALGAPSFARQGPLLHLTADQGVEHGLSKLVSDWRDPASGLSLQQANGSLQPVLRAAGIGGHPALQFDGRDVLAATTGMPQGDYTKVVVAELDAPGGALLAGSTGHALLVAGDPFHRAEVHHVTRIAEAWTEVPVGEPVVLVASYRESTGLTQIYQNGNVIGIGSGPVHADASLQLGSFRKGDYLRGKIAEVRVYDRALSPAEQQLLYTQLATKYQFSTTSPNVVFTDVPSDGQLFPRGRSGTAQVPISGVVTGAGWDTVQLEVRRDGLLWHFESKPLVYQGSEAPFALTTNISAGLHNYEIDVHVLRAGTPTLVASRVNLTCGDVFLVQGQSNAVANDLHSENTANQWASPWVRTFGAMGRTELEDVHWDRADGENEFEHGAIGSWGLRLARQLVDRYKVPIAVLNGGQGASSILHHQRFESDPTNPMTIYGRLLRRAQRAGIAEQARFLAWFQGEADWAGAGTYSRYFQELLHAWRSDYTGLERVYVFQVRDGCQATGLGVRELHRRIGHLVGVDTMSTTGLVGHDGCHFFVDGYRELADRLARLVQRDVYGDAPVNDIEAPDVLRAKRSPDGLQIQVDFRQTTDTLIWQPGAHLSFSLSDGTPIVGGIAFGSSVLLDLAAPTQATTISLLDTPGDGPWVRNARGVGALAFFDVAISP